MLQKNSKEINNNELDLLELCEVLWRSRLLITLVTFSCFTVALTYNYIE
ncbi:MAG: Wzz/FepE/Etk N-terminal domain-containing protein, partial [Pseudomonadales bacterium]